MNANDLSSFLQSVLSSKIAFSLYTKAAAQQREKRLVPDSTRRAFLSRMKGDAVISRQGAQNMKDASDMVTTAQSGVTAIKQMLTDMRKIAADALAGTYTPAQYDAATAQLKDYAQKMIQTADSTQFNGFHLLNGTAHGNGVFQLQAGNSALNEALVNLLDSSVTGGQVVNGGKINLQNFLDNSTALVMTDTASAQNVITLLDTVSDSATGIEARYSNDIKSLGNLKALLESQADIFDNARKYYTQSPEKTPTNYLDMLLHSNSVTGGIFTGNG
ncbi:hypothetical protein FACS1894206_00780 [Deltaproteobacteria bacterium]|nr:hypothetical protein FACS1894206_00780 [Deltaproteobacteria bacterium]